MLAAWLTTVTWTCLTISIIGQTIWAFTDGRRPEMPRELYEGMISAVGAMILGPAAILLAIYSPDTLAQLAVLIFIGLVVTTGQRQTWPAGYERAYPMTPTWQSIGRRSTQLSRLFITSAGAFILVSSPGNIAICGLGVIAAMNLHHFKASNRDKSLGFAASVVVAAPFLVSFVPYVISLGGGILKEGFNLSYTDLSLQVHASIPGDDPSTLLLLQNYICFMLLFYLLSLIAELALPLTQRGRAVSPYAFLALRLLRGGTTLALLMFLLPAYPTFSAQLVKYLLLIIEFTALVAPLPDIPVASAAAQRQDATSPA